MRLFIGILFDETTKKWLISKRDELCSTSIKGNFTSDNNLHLTLAFIGESSQLTNIIHSIEKINQSSFTIEIGTWAKFSHHNKDTYVIKVHENTILNELQANLVRYLRFNQILVSEQKYIPHITIGREVSLNQNILMETDKIKTTVQKISLMKSERINNKIVYTEIYYKNLGEEYGKREETKKEIR